MAYRQRFLRCGVALAALVFLVCGSLLIAAEPVTLRSLLGQMADREQLTRFPAPTYSTRFFSRGKNDQSQGYGFGLDYLEIVK